MSVMSSRAAWAIPMATAANSEPKRAPSCRWSSGCRAIFGSSAKFPVHSSRDEQVADHDVVAGGALEPAHVPDVLDLDRAGRHHAEPGGLLALDHAVDADVVGVVGAARERPAAAEPVAALVPHRLAGRVDDAGVDDVGAARVDLVVGVGRQVRVETRPFRADRRHPGDRGVGPRQLLDHGQALVRPHLVTAVRPRHVPAEDAGDAQLLREVTRHGPRLLDFLGPGLDLRQQRPDVLKDRRLLPRCCGFTRHGLKLS